MELIRALAIGLAEDEEFNGAWPLGATTFTQQNTWGGTFFTETGEELIEQFEFENGPYVEEYEEGDTITSQEYASYVAAHPNLLQTMEQARQANVGKIADLNKQIASLINDLTALSEEAGLDVTIDLGQHGRLDPNSDWDSSRC